MEMLYDETYASADGKATSRNIWYGSAGVAARGEYGVTIKLGACVRDSLCAAVKSDLAAGGSPTETNWYFYGDGMTKEAVGSNVLPAIMVRERNGAFVCNFSISDHDFAVNLDAILSFKAELEKSLAALSV